MLSEFLLSELSRLRAASELPLHRQLYEALRRVMLEGYLQAGERLASSRDLAQGLGLSRNTVITALNQLTVEGYLVSRVGSGTYVSDNCPKAARKPRARLAAQRPHLSRRGEASHQLLHRRPAGGAALHRRAFPISAPFRWRCGSGCKTSTGA